MSLKTGYPNRESGRTFYAQAQADFGVNQLVSRQGAEEFVLVGRSIFIAAGLQFQGFKGQHIFADEM